MDHSPREIPSDREAWHTTALLVSEAAEQREWGQKLGLLLNPQRRTLRKWSGNRGEGYKQSFRTHFPSVLGGSQVYALAFSAKGGLILDSLPSLISLLGLSENLSISDMNVTVSGLASGEEFSLPKPQAAYVVYLVSFIVRMHAAILLQLSDEMADELYYCDWQISPDNFPGGYMGRLFSIAANSASGLGLVRGILES